MNIDGAKVSVNKSAKECFDFFSDVANFEQLMPESIHKFQVDGDSFLFALKGMPDIRLVLGDFVKYSKVSLDSDSASSKLSFTLTAFIDETSAKTSDVQLKFEGEFNAMLVMMVKKPLTSFINTLTENIAKI